MRKQLPEDVEVQAYLANLQQKPLNDRVFQSPGAIDSTTSAR